MKLLLVDGYSLLYRAYFSSPPLTTRDGVPTGALYGFMRMLVKLVDDQQPDYALVALDAHAPTFRHESYDQYKANRKETPDELRTQSVLARELLTDLGIHHYEHIGYEGDDILGTLARHGAERGHEVLIVTGDGDALQLVNDKVSVLLTRKGVSDLDCYTPVKVFERYGFGPELLPDYKGLRGDTSDNIPGVPGIGEKTGMSLVGKFGSLESIYEHIEEVLPVRFQKLLAEHRTSAFDSRTLARIVTDLPLDIDFESCRILPLSGEQRATALAMVKRLEFKSLYARFAGPVNAENQAPEGGAAVIEPESEFEAQNAQTARAEGADVTLAWLRQHGGAPIGVLQDAERGLAFGSGEEAIYYAGAAAALRAWFEDAAAPKIVHDAKCLALALRGIDVVLRGVIADTVLMAYLLDPVRQNHPLPGLAEKYLRRSLPTSGTGAAEEKAGARRKPATLFDEAEVPAEAGEESVVWAGAAACALCGLAPALEAELRGIGEWELFTEIELPLIDVLVSIESCGMSIDEDHLRVVDSHLQTEAARLQAEIWELAGEEFNIGSTKQLQTVLFEKLALAKGRSIKTGFSTDAQTLEKLAEEHDIVRRILDYRTITKLKSTYIDILLKGARERGGRVHTNLNQTGAVSGRLSSSDPNLQNIPIRTEQGRLIRKAFVAPPGHVIVAADYSQVELRILAHITGDPPLVEAFRNDEDVHARTAADLFGVAVADVDSEMRRKAKMTNYAIAYGVSGFGLARQLGANTTPGEASEFIKRYFEALPGVKKYIDDTLEAAKAAGYVATLRGRRRPLPEINSPRQHERAAAERTAINHPIQGSAADIMKIAMLAVAEELRSGKYAARMTMQIHDELVFEVPEAEVPRLAEMVRVTMRDVPTRLLGLKVPLEVEVESGPNWNDTQPVEKP